MSQPQSGNASGAHAQADAYYSNEEIDIKQLVRAIWRYRMHVVLLGVLGVCGGLGVSLWSGRYVSEGLFLTPKLSLAAYKQYEVALGNEQHLKAFVAANHLSDTQTEYLFTRLAAEPDALGKTIKPVFSITGKEAKAYDVQTTETGALLGIQISVGRKEKTGESPIKHLADYVRHTMMEVDLRDVFLTQCLASEAKELQLPIEQLRSDFTVSQMHERAEQLRDIMRRVPNAATVDSRQVVSLEAGKERYLSPTAQLVAVEVEITEAQLANERRKRELTETRLRKAYYCGARSLQQQYPIDQQLLAQLDKLHASIFAAEDAGNDVVKQVSGEIALERRAWDDRYIQLSRFVVEPDNGEHLQRKPGLAVGAMLGGVLGGGIGFVMALLLAWWRDHGEEVLSVDSDRPRRIGKQS